jgi:N-acetylneuraminic acid mutarotase
LLLALSFSLLVILLCSCGVVGPAGAAIIGVGAASGGGGGGGGGAVAPPSPLKVSLGLLNPPSASIMYNAPNTVVLQLELEASKVDVDVSQIIITARGDVDDATDISVVRLYADNNMDGAVDGGDTQLGGDQVLTTDDGTASFSFAAATILQGTSRLYIVEVDLAGTADHGESFRLGVANRADITAIETVSLDPVNPSGPPVWGGTFSIQGVAQLEVVEGTNSPTGGGVYDGTPSVVMLQLRVTAGSAEAINLSSVTFSASGTMNDLTDITGVSLYVDSNGDGSHGGSEPQIDSTKPFSGDNGTVTFDLTGKTLGAGNTENWLVVYSLTSPLTTNDTFQVRLVAPGDISGTGAVTFVAANIVGTPVDGPVMHIQGVGSITNVVSATPPSASNVPFTGEWPIVRLQISVGPNEPVDITQITINHSVAATANPAADVSEVRLYHDVNANGRYDCYADVFLASGAYSGNSATLTSFTVTCTASANTDLLVQYVMAGDEVGAQGRTHQVTLDPTTDITATGHDTLQPITIPALPLVTGPTMTVQRNTWIAVAASGLAGRFYHTAVTDGTRAYIWGGQGSAVTFYNDGRIYDPLSNSWSTITTAGAPGVRTRHVSVWAGDKLFVWGGYNGSTYLGDGGLYDPATNSWTPINSNNAPTSRMDAVAVWTGNRVVIWGGYAGGHLDTGASYFPQTDTWVSTATGSGCPDGRRSTAADWNGTYMIVWGGDKLTYLDDGGRYNPSGNSWSSIPTAGAPTERALHTGIWCSDRFIVWGGYDGTTYLDTGAWYMGTGWTDTDNLGAPIGRSDHTAVWDGKYMIAWGGQTDTGASDLTQSGSRLDPSDNSWAATSTTSAPSARRLHIGVWTGAGMIIWGGGTSTSVIPPTTATGGRYLP